jgi:hypothetical protein
MGRAGTPDRIVPCVGTAAQPSKRRRGTVAYNEPVSGRIRTSLCHDAKDIEIAERRLARERRPSATGIAQFPVQRLATALLSRRNVGDSSTPGVHTAETGLAGWIRYRRTELAAQHSSHTPIEPVSFRFEPRLYTATRILKIVDQRLARQIARLQPKIKKIPPQRLSDISPMLGNVAPILLTRTSPTETGLAGWGGTSPRCCS